MAKTPNALCENVNDDIKEQALTLAKAIIAMQNKIEQQLPIFKKMLIYQETTSTRGEKVIKSNPAVQEFRAIVRDYASVLKSFDEITKNHSEEKEESNSSLDNFRNQMRMVK